MMGLVGSLSYVAYTIGAIVCALAAIWIGRKSDPVSYTHLTLPTTVFV